MKSNDINDFVEQFDGQLIKLDENNKVMLVDNVLGIKEVVYLKSKRGHKIIRRMAKSSGLKLSQKGVEEVSEELEAAAFDLDVEPIKHHKRYALSSDGISTLIDMCNGSIVKLSLGKVEIVNNVTDTYFMRPDFQQPIVMPNLGLSNKQIPVAMKDLRSFINTDDVTYFILVGYITYLLATPKAKGLPYPILVIQGDKGSGKSFFCNNIIRGLVDPSTMSGVALTKKMDDYALILNSMFLAVFDNLRSLTKTQSDVLCTTATKGSAPRRTLYTTDELTLLELHSPLVLNAIHDIVKESDLASRCVHVRLKPMLSGQRKSEQLLKAELDTLMPDIYGALLMLTAKAMEVLPKVKVMHSARMMDFAQWLGALEQVLGLAEGKLQLAYQRNVESLMASGMVDDSLTIALQKLIKTLKEGEAWRSAPSGLLTKLQEFENSHFLPKGAAALTAKMKGQESSLNANGIYFKLGRDSERYVMVSASGLSQP